MTTRPSRNHRVPRATSVAVVIAIGCIVIAPAAGPVGPSVALAAEVQTGGRLGLEAGHLAHPLGLASDQATPYAHGGLVYEVGIGEGPSRVEISYAGDVTVFDPDVGLGYRRHALGLEYVHRGADRHQLTWSAGVQGALRRQDPAYAVYDHDELRAYLTARAYPHPRLMTRITTSLRVRRYGVLPEESFIEPSVQLLARHFSPSRLTLGASLRLGGKWFHDPVAPAVWDTDGTPATTQLAASLEAARGLTDRVSIRATMEQRLQLGGFPYYVSEQIYDSPLLDRYARSGPAAAVSLKVIGPRQVWVQLGGDWRRNDYGAIRFAGETTGGEGREDTVRSVWLSLERRLAMGDGQLRLRLQTAWTDQASSLAAYRWSGPVAGLSAQWLW